MTETLLVVCDNCGAKPRHESILTGWAKVELRFSMSLAMAMAGSPVVPRTFDLCPECVNDLAHAKQNGYPRAPERVA